MMQDQFGTQEQLLMELAELRERVMDLEKSEAACRQAESQARESESRFRAIADYTYDWECWVDPIGKLEWINPAVFHLTGYTVDECMAMPDFPLPLINEEDRDKMAGYFAEAVGGSSGNDVEFRLRCKDGGLKWVAISWQPIYDATGPCLGHRSSVRDITDRKRTEEALRKSEARFHQFVEQAPLPVCFVNEEGVIVYFNDRFLTKFGYTHADLPDLDSWWHLAYPDEQYRRWVRDFWNGAVKKATEETSDIEAREYNVTCKDGTVLNVEISGITMEGNFLATFIDVTGRKRAEEELKQSESRLSSIIEFLPDATFVRDLEGKVITWNKAVEEMTGFSAEMMLGKGSHEYAIPFYGERRPLLVDLLFMRDEEIEKKYPFIKKEGDTLYTETDVPFVRRPGRTVWVKASPLRNEEGEIIGAIESVRDITERKQAEKERERLFNELQDSIARIKTLHGLLPICASCKRIRNDKGRWEQMEVYIRDRSDAEFSHGICPECAKKLYPEYHKE